MASRRKRGPTGRSGGGGSITTRASTRAHQNIGVVIKQEEKELPVVEEKPAAARAVKRSRRASSTVAVAASVVGVVKKEDEKPAATPMRNPKAATAAAAAAAATIVTSFDFLPTLAPAGLFVGCSGCSYKHLHASKAQSLNFYPFPSAAREFGHYAAHFNSLEINYSFYHIPSPETCARWRAQAPRPDFLYALKANRYFSHTKRIHVDEWFKKKWEEAFWPRCQESLDAWAEACWRWRWRQEGQGLSGPGASEPRRVFAFFNNDASMDDLGETGLPSAVADAHRLGRLLARRLEADSEEAEAGSGAAAATTGAAKAKREQP